MPLFTELGTISRTFSRLEPPLGYAETNVSGGVYALQHVPTGLAYIGSACLPRSGQSLTQVLALPNSLCKRWTHRLPLKAGHLR